MYKQPELNKMEYQAEEFVAGSGGYDSPIVIDAKDNELTLNWSESN